jgi:chorismate mutase/prephenate dehydratase
LESIGRVYSKPDVFTQCRRWLMETGLFSRTVAMPSTSAAAEKAAGEPGAAAIGSELAAELFGLHKVCDRIEDDADNVTRFLVIGGSAAPPTGRDKTSVMFQAADRPGALVDVLEVFRQAGVNMTYIESRPSRRGKWEYVFFADLEGHIDDPGTADVIAKARLQCNQLKVLGSFPRADEIV